MDHPEPVKKIVMVVEPSKREIRMIDKEEFADGRLAPEGDGGLFGGSDDPLDWSDGN
jgi:hypothetical protein